MCAKEDKERLVKLMKYGLCGCHHNNGTNLATEPHTCPFAEEIRGSYELCNCCEECEHNCAMDI